jgi:pimeloyl-ACP methyl ester carboxylesterase
MSNQRTHYATTSDGVTIGGTVHGQGPALVFLQGAVGDGDLDWRSVVEHLTDRHTCHLPSMRGRGLSGNHPDLGTSRIIEDFTTYVDSIGEPAGLVGWSGGGYFALGVAEMLPDAVTAVALFEPGILTLMDDAEKAVVGAAVARAAELAAGGDLSAAARAFLQWPFTDEDIAGAEDVGYIEAAARYVPNLLSLLQQAMEEDAAAAIEDPAVLGTISAPMLVLRGSETKPFFTTSTRHVVDHVPNARMQEIPGAGHAAPLTHPKALAGALTEFFSPSPQPLIAPS